MDIDFLITSFVALFVIIDPIGLTPLFIALTQGMSAKVRRKITIRAIGVAFFVLMLFALFVETVLGFIPACKALGIDLVHFGVLVVVNSMIGLITPPYGILLIVINAVTGIPIKEIISEIWLFFGVLILALLTMIFIPDIVLWLPKLLGYTG